MQIIGYSLELSITQALLGKAGRHSRFCRAVALLWGSLQGVGIFGSLSHGLIQEHLQSQLVFQVFRLTRTLRKVKAISIFLCWIRTDQSSASASSSAILSPS